MSPEKQVVLATMDEIARAQQQLGIPADEGEFDEAWYILERIERHLEAKRIEETTL